MLHYNNKHGISNCELYTNIIQYSILELNIYEQQANIVHLKYLIAG